MPPPRLLALAWAATVMLAAATVAEVVRELEISELAPVGSRVGFIGDANTGPPPYLIVPVPGSHVDSDLVIERTGEIRTRVPLDRETRASYSLVAIPNGSGENVRVLVRVIDENDNAPTFPQPVVHVEFPENTPRDVKRTLLPARDLDLGAYNTQRYAIVSGNTNNAFRLSSHRERDDVLYLDLQINGFLDRETVPEYSLVIEAYDGGKPPLKGSMLVNITIQDVNDNQPLFDQTRYFANIAENATVGTSVIQVSAVDADAGSNGKVEYSINRRQSDKDSMFSIDSQTGLIAINKPLDFETKEVHELVVVARDHGDQPLETTAFVTIRVMDVNDNQPTINLIFLSDDASPKISESAKPGEFVARISVNDPDSKTEYSNVNVTLEGGDGRFGLTTRDNIIYLVIVSLPLDREKQSNYTLSVIATDQGTPPLHASRTFALRVTDINDNAPEFVPNSGIYHASIPELAEPGSRVLQVHAIDRDEGNNSVLTYEILNTPETHSNWFSIDSRTGQLTTRTRVDCDTDPVPQVTIIARDNGQPPLSATAKVLVTIQDVNDNEPLFDHSFYNVTVHEDDPVGSCILKVSATDPDCGVNAMVNYTLGAALLVSAFPFELRPGTGELCLSAPLDYEQRNGYEFPVVATDRGGLSTTAMVNIQVLDVNDNAPVFYPSDYNVSVLVSEPGSASNSGPLLIVAATDRDAGLLGRVTYTIVTHTNFFRVDNESGEVFVTSGLSSAINEGHVLVVNVSATDGGGLRAAQDARIFVTLISADAHTARHQPRFEKPRYAFVVKENVQRNTVIGTVRATAGAEFTGSGRGGSIHYSITSGDPAGLFTIDPALGVLRTAAELDHERQAGVLLNVQAAWPGAARAHTQVHISIDDVNDNRPQFESSLVRLSVPESVALGVPLYSVTARDLDSGRNGLVRYLLRPGAASLPTPFAVDPRLGHLTLTRHLDYEASHRHTVMIIATDQGEPPLSTNMTVLVEVQDVNDNAPKFERLEYSVSVSEVTAINTQLLQVAAVDLDTGNNARITFRLLTSENGSTSNSGPFALESSTGWLYLTGPLDRETNPRHVLSVAATDNGTPPLSARASIVVTVLDANDNDPHFEMERYQFVVEENRPLGARVGIVRASDADADENAALRYSLAGDPDAAFQINLLTGEITTLISLDRESRASYELVAEARDQGATPRSGRVSVRIAVADVNDNAPEIVDPGEDVVRVREEQPIGIDVVRVRATDRDIGENATVTYSLLRGRDTDGHGVFSIDPTTGTIRTRAVLDHEDRAIYRLAVAATDGGSPPKQTVRLLSVEVLDLNDNRPTFSSSSLVFTVAEDMRIGHKLGTVAASTATLSGNNLIDRPTYTLSYVGSSSPAAIDIDTTTGDLFLARELDREREAFYQLEVRVFQAANHPQSALVNVRIEVSDVNDNAPKWSKDPVYISTSEDTTPGTILANLTAKDADSGPNAEIRYNLVRQYPNQPTGTFIVDPLTGTLTLEKALDYEVVSQFTLIILAIDQAVDVNKRHSSSLTLIVSVSDVNDNTPQFVSPITSPEGTSLVLGDNIRSGDVITRFLATDADGGDNGLVSYTLEPGHEWLSLDPTTGVLSVIHAPPPTVIFPTINVTAWDHGRPPRRATRRLPFTIDPVKDNPPRFLHGIYEVNVTEDAPIGTFVAKLEAHVPGAKGNVTYEIPEGVGGGLFRVDAITGVVRVAGVLDREIAEEISLPVLAVGGRFDSSSTSNAIPTTAKQRWAASTLKVRLLDVNDNEPTFKAAACYPLHVPENSDLATIHTVVASDRDAGANGEITYSITGGNIGNKFSIDAQTGALRARPLDRETQAQYVLSLAAQDGGKPPLTGRCEITVTVLDQNDNDPVFARQRYSSTVAEDAPPGTSVVHVQATDPDLGVNSRITYSLGNESQWLFRIDNMTGLITTAGLFDRERQASYSFVVVATDGGRYDARSAQVPVRVTVIDVNDNRPSFTKYPFVAEVPAYTQPGQNLVKVSATDADEGTNGDIVYSVISDDPSNSGASKFRINPKTGSVTAATSLALDAGKTFRLEIAASDKGNPPLSSRGLVEIRVAGSPGSDNTATLRCQNASYDIEIPENTLKDAQIAYIAAIRTDGRRQRVSYSLASEFDGADDGTFAVDSDTGIVTVANPSALDYETRPHRTLVVVAQAKADGHGHGSYGYCQVNIAITDVNDNAPRFTQQEYSAVVWEGNNKGTFVIQVSATDADSSELRYHIVDGNHDNAFVIEPPFSGLVKTNIVLDREIRDSYKLTVIATDDGTYPSLTGTATLRINIVDANDNQPTFPPHNAISVSEASEIGSVLTAVTANDVDTNPALTYSLADEFENGSYPRDVSHSYSPFTIDRFSGKIILIRELDFETQREYRLRVIASDTAHTAHTELVVRVTDVNDHTPKFDSVVYQGSLPESSGSQYVITRVNATDLDSDINGQVTYSLLETRPGFYIDSQNGVVLGNRSALSENMIAGTALVRLVVVARDLGRPPLQSTVAVVVSVGYGSNSRPRFLQEQYRIHIREDSQLGVPILKLNEEIGLDNRLPSNDIIKFRIIEGNIDNVFDITSPTGDLVVSGTLDRETIETYVLRIIAFTPGGVNSSAIEVRVNIDDANDNPPQLTNPSPENSPVTISETALPGELIVQLEASDADQPGTPNSQLTFELTSGNDLDLFALEPSTGVITVKRSLDYDHGPTQFRLVVQVSDVSLSTLGTVNIYLLDENDNAPLFPGEHYRGAVAENEPPGSIVWRGRTAIDLDKGQWGALKYRLSSDESDAQWFRCDLETGAITSAVAFDYESRARYEVTVEASDPGGLIAKTKLIVAVESRDEFAPQFTERSYKFAITREMNILGNSIGIVRARDQDSGPDGNVYYQLSTPNQYFKVNRTSGAIVLRKKLSLSMATTGDGVNTNTIMLGVTASSGRQGSLNNMTIVEIAIDPSGVTLGGSLGSTETTLTGSSQGGTIRSGLPDWAVALMVALLLLLLVALAASFLYIHIRKKGDRNGPVRHGTSKALPPPTTGVHNEAFHDTTAPSAAAGVFGPPKYDEISQYVGGGGGSSGGGSGAATASELGGGSDQCHSGSSGRGSAEEGDVEDEEIRMINEAGGGGAGGGGLNGLGGLNHGNHNHLDELDLEGASSGRDNLSDISVQNTQQYLARLGIVESLANLTMNYEQQPQPPPPPPPASNDDITNLIYAKLNDVEEGSTSSGAVLDVIPPGNFGDVTSPGSGGHQPPMSGSLSSIVHSEEELTGSYNWDYLLDWGPQYQPLAHVFSEIARLKDDSAPSTTNQQGPHSGGQGVLGSQPTATKLLPPPLLTSVAPRSVAVPRTSAPSSSGSSQVQQQAHPMHLLMLPRSPISHDSASGAVFSTSAAMSPSFSPSLSPLATRSPSISPLVPAQPPHGVVRRPGLPPSS